jgi:hypothetical protein
MGSHDEARLTAELASIEAEVLRSMTPDDGDQRTVWERIRARLDVHPLTHKPGELTEDDYDRITDDEMADLTPEELRIVLREGAARLVAVEIARRVADA